MRRGWFVPRNSDESHDGDTSDYLHNMQMNFENVARVNRRGVGGIGLVARKSNRRYGSGIRCIWL